MTGIRSNRDCVLARAEKYTGVREATGNNDGLAVERFLKGVGLPKGYAWCAAYVKAVYADCGVDTPINAMAASAVPASRRIWGKGVRISRQPQPGDAFGVYYSYLGRIGHTGLVVDWGSTSLCRTNEGNTNNNGSREGIGVFSKWRQKNQIHSVASWL